MNDGDPESERLAEEIGRIQELIRSPGFRRKRKGTGSITGLRPRNAATLLIIDRSGGQLRVLMGRRHPSLKFMPGALVFPGGAVDSNDGSVLTRGELPDSTRDKVVANLRGRPSVRAARALGLAAIREVAEETGLLIGESGHADLGHPDWQRFSERAVVPSLAGFSLLSRAITPPGPPRRFDTWFFAVDAGAIGHVPRNGFDPGGELEGLTWIRPEDAILADTREITRVMLVELMNRLSHDPHLDPEHPAPFYYTDRGRFMRTLM